MPTLLSISQIRQNELSAFVKQSQSDIIYNYSGYLNESGSFINHKFNISTGIESEQFYFDVVFKSIPYVYSEIVAPTNSSGFYINFLSDITSSGFKANYSSILSGTSGYYLNVLAGIPKRLDYITESSGGVYDVHQSYLNTGLDYIDVSFSRVYPVIPKIFYNTVAPNNSLYGYIPIATNLTNSGVRIIFSDIIEETGHVCNVMAGKDEMLQYVSSGFETISIVKNTVNTTGSQDISGDKSFLDSCLFLKSLGATSGFYTQETICENNGYFYNYLTNLGIHLKSGYLSNGYGIISLNWKDKQLTGNWQTNTSPSLSGHIVNKGYADTHYFIGSGSPTPPSNTSSPNKWADIWISGIKYKTPLYL